jgi:hypothetical protein
MMGLGQNKMRSEENEQSKTIGEIDPTIFVCQSHFTINMAKSL